MQKERNECQLQFTNKLKRFIHKMKTSVINNYIEDTVLKRNAIFQMSQVFVNLHLNILPFKKFILLELLLFGKSLFVQLLSKKTKY